MLIDLARDADALAGRRFDVCVIGAGAAGVPLARALMQAGHSVCLAESGGLDFEERTQALYKGENVGMPYYDLEESRLRFFGGTVSIWGGRCALFDDIDFRRRDWVPHSGWPIGRADLMPWYRQAHEIFEIGPFEWDDAYRLVGIADQGFDPEKLATELWRFDEASERFAASRAKDLIDAPNVTVLLHANAVKLQAAANAGSIEHVEVRSLGGRSAVIAATHFVLACGAIENARLMLASDDVEAAGVGNAHDQVGRFFMEHPTGRIARADTTRPFDLWAAYQKRFMKAGPPLAPVLRLADAVQESEGALNSIVTFKLQRDPNKGVALGNKLYGTIKHSLNPNRTGRTLDHLYRGMRAWFHRVVREPIEAAMANAGMTGLYLIIRGEQAPNPDSRVLLSAARDELGQRRADLSWQLSALDKHTARVVTRVFDEEMRRMGKGSVTPSEWLSEPGPAWPVDPTVGNHPIAGYHHLGGTRMSADPRHGVVDADCRVHGYANLHVAGSSVFATAGWANPTLTIVAFALRLADRLDGLLRK
ncbi:FAD-dependent oxidoreductase [Novosphingobium album (ex Liu et al. 2023)]|uniref:GMC family oxidoreductase n=1 Tax=Novosphingobium album (ex Liu et al. 2023) TaxID=3031130 RepID=A0ABT5WV15_9SPHN|nr:GMC family oxidoreductase [Novosphingobium album (ex Liu et al. 2023)]MDE8653745.1 GMC family oxidoreductase [Novosphingobium album (ex Liu et al. 2023)]